MVNHPHRRGEQSKRLTAIYRCASEANEIIKRQSGVTAAEIAVMRQGVADLHALNAKHPMYERLIGDPVLGSRTAGIIALAAFLSNHPSEW